MNSSPINSYPWYVPDWQGSETRLKLSLAHRGLFRELLDHCHTEGSIPDDMEMIARMCGASLKEIKRLFPGLRDQFVKQGDRLVNPKAAEVRSKLLEYHNGRKKAGTAGAKKRWAKSIEFPSSSLRVSSELPSSGHFGNPNEDSPSTTTTTESTKGHGGAIAERSLSYSLPQPQPSTTILNTCSSEDERDSNTPIRKPEAKTPGWGKPERSRFFRESFWLSWPRKVAKSAAEKAWLKHASTPEDGLNAEISCEPQGFTSRLVEVCCKAQPSGG